MNKIISVIGGDLRIVKLIELLVEDDFTVYTYGFENSDEMPDSKKITRCKSLKEAVKSADVIIGPMPLSIDKKNISTPFSDEKILVDELIREMAKKDKTFIAGKIPDEVLEKLQKEKINAVDLLKREELAVLNTISTAEGTIQLAMEETQRTIHGSKILVMGFGRVRKSFSQNARWYRS